MTKQENTHLNIKQRGIALIQVLLITAILSVFAIYLSHTAKDQVQIAQWVNDKVSAQVALHNAESVLLFNLLTMPLQQKTATEEGFIDDGQENNDNITSNWNFHNKNFQFGEHVNISIQDQAGLIDIHYPKHEIFKPFILSLGYSDEYATKTLDTLLDWQDIDNIPRQNGIEQNSTNGPNSGVIRNGAIPNLEDLHFIPNMSATVYNHLLKNSTVYRRHNFNPMNSSVELLTALSSRQIAEQVVLLRKMNQLNKRNFSELTGIKENDGYYFSTSNYLAIKFISQVSESIASKEIIIKLSPIATSVAPLNFYLNRS